MDTDDPEVLKFVTIAFTIQSLNYAIEALIEQVENQTRQILTLEAKLVPLEPVLWICYNEACGAPNETPALFFGWVVTTLMCQTCHYIQPYSHVHAFLQEGPNDPGTETDDSTHL